MASATAIMAQANPALLISFPTWKQPVLLHLKATIAAAGAATVVSAQDTTTGEVGTTPGVSITTTDAGATYDVTFPPCRSIALGTVQIQVLPNVLATVTERRTTALDKTDANTSAKLGKLRFSTLTNTGAATTAPVSGSEIHLSFWADLG